MQKRPTPALWFGQAPEGPLVENDPGFWEWLKEKNAPKDKGLDNNLYLEIPLPTGPIKTEDSESLGGSRATFEVDINYIND